MQCSWPMCPYHLADQHLLPIFYAILQTNIFIANFSVILQTNCNCQFFYASLPTTSNCQFFYAILQTNRNCQFFYSILQTNINFQFFRAVLLTNIRGVGKAISIVTQPKSPLPLPLAINSDRSLKKILCVSLIGNYPRTQHLTDVPYFAYNKLIYSLLFILQIVEVVI